MIASTGPRTASFSAQRRCGTAPMPYYAFVHHTGHLPPVRRHLVVCGCVNRPTAIRFRVHDDLPASGAEQDDHQAGLAAAPDGTALKARPRIVVLGTGWASMSLLKALPTNISDEYDVVLVSPRNYFLYTPLLPAVAAGSMEERSIVEPVRKLMHGKGRFYEAVCSHIDPVRKQVTACYPKENGVCSDSFTLDYDLLLIGVGSVNNTFGVPGVSEHCCFLKSLEDAHRLRMHVIECFERAALPHASDDERRQLLSFVVCGGGPTGVEVAAELHDMIHDDLSQQFPDLMPYVKVSLVEMMDHVLSSYNARAGSFAEHQLAKEGVDLLLSSRVLRVSERAVTVADKEGGERHIPFGACVWATGIGMHPLVKQLQQAMPDVQTHGRCVLTDEFLRVEGGDGSIWAFGDAASIHLPFATEHADALFAEADADGDGLVDSSDLQRLLHENKGQFPQLGQHTLALDIMTNRFAGLVTRYVLARDSSKALAALGADGKLDRAQFSALLQDFDSSLRALPATAQVAAQEGQFVAELLLKNEFDPRLGTLALSDKQKPFHYFHKGSLAYVGNDRAIMDVPVVGPITGVEAGVMWRGYETIAQASPRNMLLVLQNFVRTKVFGRDVSSV